MHRVRLIHWNATEATERAKRLTVLGFDVDHTPLVGGGASRRQLRENPPAAVVIDLSRLPMQGRDVAFALRHAKATREVPLVFVDGEPEKVARVKAQLPDAVYTTWDRIGGALKRAVAHPPEVRVVPRSALDGYAGTPLAKKLGIRANSVTVLVDAPPDFEQALRDLPEGASVRRRAGGRRDLTVWFVRSRQELERRIGDLLEVAVKGGLWIAWPKKASGIATDLTQVVVRKVAMAAGLVDFKVAALDAAWTGLRFTRRDVVKSP